MQQYSQLRAMLAVTKASLTATFRSPQSIFFSLFFPIVLIWIFGSLSGGGGIPTVDVAWEKGVDSSTVLYQQLEHNPALKFADPKKKDIEDELVKGRITAVIDVKQTPGAVPYVINLRTSSASQREMGQLLPVLKYEIDSLDRMFTTDRKTIANINTVKVPGRKYKMIDFFLPGMIGFSLIGSAVFGVAFLFFSLRETLVLKRMYATPISKGSIILGESFSKVLFQLLTVVVLIAFGYFMYHFTLANGIFTFFDMLLLSCLGLLVFMGFGFLISGISRNQNVIPIYANLFMFPQYFLSGTFFPKSALPEGLQPFLKFLPLTALNDSLRNVAFEGSSLWSCWPQILIMVVWGAAVYLVTAKFFRWE
ncbi:ABC transporter permease [Flavisolibacter ginsenosidimutans]|uniref:Transport permease protein n=1 Tax=Flavisolibacter ginsenosidimutans TaxID=661481 RepID=A0A5B8UNQ5_9BACT|nr:ABC transporter permease [Flavisolibacter ginsenosidimutans]QEC58311.1 ABC transporter permease [Flavisolibacter ginsenosidimutans]